MSKNELYPLVDKLDLLVEDFKKLAKSIMIGKSLDMDYFALATINRSISILQGFRTLYLDENVLAAVNLIRIQIDNLIRFNSFSIAKDEKYLDYVLSGQAINKFKDSDDKKFTDFYLVQETDKIFKIKEIYNKYCGFIHFGKEHLDYIKSNPNEENVKCRIEIGNLNSFSFQELDDFVKEMVFVSLKIYNMMDLWRKSRLTILKNLD